MTIATGVGSWPGDDTEAFLRATRAVLEGLPDLPHLPELPGRGPGATMTGRALAVLSGLGVGRLALTGMAPLPMVPQWTTPT